MSHEDDKLREPPAYVPSIDVTFLEELDKKDRWVVSRLDEMAQGMRWQTGIVIKDHNAIIDLRNKQEELEKSTRIEQEEIKKSIQTLERENPVENRTMIKWIRENMVAPAKIIGWLIAAAVGALISAYISGKLHIP